MSPHEDPAEPLVEWLQDSLSAEHFLRKSSEHLLAHELVARDAEACLVVRALHGRSQEHLLELERLLERREEAPSGLLRAVGTGLGASLGWLQHLPNRSIVQTVRDVYTALNYAAGGYHVLYTRAVLLEAQPAGEVALRHLRTYTPLVRQLSQLMTWAAALDVSEERWRGKPLLGEVVDTLTASWSSEHQTGETTAD